MGEAVIGIDVGGTTTAVGVIDREGAVLGYGEIPTRGDEPVERFVKRVVELARSLPHFRRAIAVGIGAPNADPRSGVVVSPPNLSWGERTDLVSLFSQALPLPVSVTNDANAAALGELHFGGGRGMTDLVVVTIGTGLGSGIVSAGKLLLGHSGFAGELGHTVVDPGGRLCGCGKRGCLEAYVSAGGIIRTARELYESEGEKPPLPLDPATIAARAAGGDPVARQTYEETGRILGIRLADLVALLSPRAIFLTGGVARAGELLLEPTFRSFAEHLFVTFRGTVEILPSSLPAGEGAVLGAAALAWERCTASSV